MSHNITLAQVRQICARHQIEIKHVETVTGSFNKKIFIINQEILLRVSASPMASEQEKFSRVADLKDAPKILHIGELDDDSGSIFYTILTFLPGENFVTAYPKTSLEQQKQLGRHIARFLDDLQAITDSHYDIGLYVPAVPGFSGTWMAGHQEYWQILERGAAQLNLQPDSRRVFIEAFQFLQASTAALNYQAGPKLLHNDLHPANILLDHGNFAGVIDWECSQFGEPDFELTHLIHWCVYPPHPDIDYRPFLQALFQAAPACTHVPSLAQRLTIYQIEHEIQQIIWQGVAAESQRVPRLAEWLAGGVERLLNEISAPLL